MKCGRNIFRRILFTAYWYLDPNYKSQTTWYSNINLVTCTQRQKETLPHYEWNKNIAFTNCYEFLINFVKNTSISATSDEELLMNLKHIDLSGS